MNKTDSSHHERDVRGTGNVSSINANQTKSKGIHVSQSMTKNKEILNVVEAPSYNLFW
jgi:hypothetical protein